MEPLPYYRPRPASTKRRWPIWFLIPVGGLLHFLMLMFAAFVSCAFEGANAEWGTSHFARMMERLADRAGGVLLFPALPAPDASSTWSILLRGLANALIWGTAFAVLVRLIARRPRATA